DATVAYCSIPGEDERFDHPHRDSDDCTAIGLDAAVVEALRRDHGGLPVGPIPTSPAIDLQHRVLLAAGRRGDDLDVVFEAALATVADVVGQAGPSGRGPLLSGRAASARVNAVGAAREALAVDPGLSLPQLGAAVGVSPHHLSRIFRAATGVTISRYRM